MTKLESAEEIIRQDGQCVGSKCNKTCCIVKECEDCCNNKERLYYAIKYKKEHEITKFKVGDWVSSKSFNTTKYFEGIKQIDDFIINCAKEKRALILGTEGRSFSLNNLNLVCEFTKSQEVEVSDDDENWRKGLFYQFDTDLRKYLVQDKRNLEVFVAYKYCRAIQPKYKAYTEVKIEWLDNKKVLDKDTGIEWDINYLGKDNKVTIGNEHEYSLTFMFEHFTWIDGTPFGEEIK